MARQCVCVGEGWVGIMQGGYKGLIYRVNM